MVEALEKRELLSAAPAAASAAHDDGRVYAPHATVRGRTLGQWAAAWTQWAFSAPANPADQNPLLDETGAAAGLNQPDDVFFLGGNFGGTSVRRFEAPSGTPLYFPVLNYFWINVAADGDPPFAQNEANIRALLGAQVAAFTDLFATIDGKAVGDLTSHVEEDPPGGFQIDFPDDNVFGRPADQLGLAAIEGEFLMVHPLEPGRHVIHFGGRSGDFSLDVTDVITVVPKGQYRKGPPVTATVPAPRVGSGGPAAEVGSHDRDDDKRPAAVLDRGRGARSGSEGLLV
jgi:hypothetical protein